MVRALKSVLSYAEATVEMFCDTAVILDIKNRDRNNFEESFREKWSGLGNLLKIVEEWMKGQTDQNDEMKETVFES
jgi:hypothetical protein